MSKEDCTTTSGGLLSKMVRFVRNPTVNWSDLDAVEADRESQYSKQMLKEMIERKRRNDFVRRREFDQLRKLRQREALHGQRPEDITARTSFFQTSMTSPDERAVTLKKIDEIEAQMSQQWWKGKGSGETPAPTPAAPAPDGAALPAASAAPAPRPAPVAAAAFAAAPTAGQPSPAAAAMAAALASSGLAGDPARAFAPTAPLSLPPTLDKAPAVEPMFHDASPVVVPPPLAEDAPQPAPSQPEKFVHEPDLEEAAIRFANGDYAGAEAGLKEVLVQHEHSDPQQQHDIWMTLFDLYRATGQQEPFDALAI
ncbi:MAG: hypothetical protein DI574_09375, partial [Acidovorax sp.]